MRNLIRRVAAVAAAAAGFFALLLTLIVPNVMQAANASNGGNGGGGGNAASCSSTATYYAYDAPNAHGPGSTANFGPDLKVANTGEALAKFDESMAPCKGDPLATATRLAFLRDGEAMDPVAVQAEAKKIADDRGAWQSTVDAIRGDIVDVKLVSIDANFDSLGMTLGNTPKDMPTLGRFAQLQHMDATLEVKTKEGATRHFRISCFFQPSVLKEFLKVIKEKIEQPKPEQSQQPCTTCQCAGNCTTVQCTTCECLGNCVQQCTTCECAGNCVQCTTCTCLGNCPTPQCTTCSCTNTCLTPKGGYVNNPGVVPLQSGPLTNGQQSQQQKQSGQTSGNVTDSKVPSGTTSGSTTPDLPQGTVTAPGATPAPQPAPGSSPAPKDPYAGSPGTGGTGGATCQPDPFTGAGC